MSSSSLIEKDRRPAFKVVIVGGGIAGLALAHGLQRLKTGRDVQVCVYEKSSDESCFTKYPIHIASDGRQGLSSILSSEGYADLVDRSDYGVQHGGITITSQDLCKRFCMRQDQGAMPQFVQRAELRTVLASGVNVVKGVSVLELIQVENGVKVFLDNDSQDFADLVVGADGVGSVVRAQIYPELRRLPTLPYLTVSFKLKLTALLLTDPHGINLVLGRTNYSLLLVPLKSAYIYAIATNPMFDCWRNTSGLCWQMTIAAMLKADRAHPSLQHAIQNGWVQGSEAVWPAICMDTRKAPKYTSGRVILIGDAAHAMPPHGGVGGSTALKDAAELCDALMRSDSLQGHMPLEHVLADWHASMMRRAMAHLKDAKRRLELSIRQGMGVYTQRMVLKLMSVIWPIYAKVAGSCRRQV